MADESGEEVRSAGDINLLDVLLVLAENARLLIFGSLGAGLLALGIAFLIPPTFTATTRILPPQQQSATAMLTAQLGALSALAGSALNIKNPADTYVALIKSRTVADHLIDRFKLMSLYGHDYRNDARAELESRTRVVLGKDGLITIEVDDRDPKRAADLANAYTSELSKLTGSLAITEAQQRRLFFEKQLQQAQTSLNASEAALSQSGAGEALIKSAPQAVVEGIARLKAQVTAQEVRLSTMRTYMTDSNPEYILAQRELASLRAQLTQAESNQPDKNGAHSGYLNKYRDFKYNETLFELLAKQYEMARLDEARESAVVQVVDPAQPPERKSKPKRGIIAILTTVAAFFVLVIFIYARDTFREMAKEAAKADKIARLRRFLRLRHKKPPL